MAKSSSAPSLDDGSGPRLLRRDIDALRRAAFVARSPGSGFVVIACPRSLEAGALAVLRDELAVPALQVTDIDDAAAVRDALAAAQRDPQPVSFRLKTYEGDPLHALNLRRDDLVGGAPVLLWLDGRPGLVWFKKNAPDADRVSAAQILVHGDGFPFQRLTGGSREAGTRKRLESLLERRARGTGAPPSPVEIAQVQATLGEILLLSRRFDEAEKVLLEGLSEIPEERYPEATPCLTRARLYQMLMENAFATGAWAKQDHWLQTALKALSGADELEEPHRAAVGAMHLALTPGPEDGLDHARCERALGMLSPTSAPLARVTVTVAAATARLAAGHTTSARDLLSRLHVKDARSLAKIALVRAMIALRTGAHDEAESAVRESITFNEQIEASAVPEKLLLAQIWLASGEIEAAERMRSEIDEKHEWYPRGLLDVAIDLAASRWGELLAGVESGLRAARAARQEGRYLALCERLADAADAAEGNDRARIVAAAQTALREAEAVAREAGWQSVPPWLEHRIALVQARWSPSAR